MNSQANGLARAPQAPLHGSFSADVRGGFRLSAKTLAVTGGKGGVGKSSISASLATVLAQRGDRVLACDLDFALGNLGVLLGLEPARRVEDFFDGIATLEDCIVRSGGGGEPTFDLLPAGSGTRDLARPDLGRRRSLLAELQRISSRYDWIVLDTAAGIGPDVLEFCLAATRTLLVATPEPASLTDAYGVLKALDALAGERGLSLATPGVFANRVADPDHANELAGRISRVAERFLGRTPRLAGWCPESREVARATAAQRPFASARRPSLASRSIERLAARYEAELSGGAGV